MIHPLLRLVATQPQLLADHAEAYAGLFSEEIGRTVSGVKQRLLLTAVALGLIAVAAILGGVALMLWAVIPPSSVQSSWALLAAPGLPLIVGIICLLVGKKQPTERFAELKQQMAADLVMLREVSAA